MIGKPVFDAFPLIQPSTPNSFGTPYFGGNQSWYPRYTPKAAGCGPVAAANILATFARQNPVIAKKLSLTFEKNGQIRQEVFLAFMEDLYATMGSLEIPLLHHFMDNRTQAIHTMLQSQNPKLREEGQIKSQDFLSKTPVSMGNTGLRFIYKTIQFARQRGITLTPHLRYTFGTSPKKGYAFIRTGLEKGSPIALMTWLNQHDLHLYRQGWDAPPDKTILKNSHFLTIAGIRTATGQKHTPPQLLVSTWGLPAAIPYPSLCRSWQYPPAAKSALIYFTYEASI